jgi:integrase/recombinase XerC
MLATLHDGRFGRHGPAPDAGVGGGWSPAPSQGPGSAESCQWLGRNAGRRRRPQVAPVDPQRAINRRWEGLLARRYPGTRWEVVRDDGAEAVTRRASSASVRASTRPVVSDVRLAEINEVAARTGNDPELDVLLVRLHFETACRHGGALALRPKDLDSDQCLVRLRERVGAFRWQPVTPTLMVRLQRHVEQRHPPRDAQLLRYRSGRAITCRRYDYLWRRLGELLPWVATEGISTDWLCHTTLTWVERTFSYAVARAYAGHMVGAGLTCAADTGVRTRLQDVAAALSALTGEPHPLVTQ